MLNSNDIYSHLLNGGEIKDLYVALDKEIMEANKKIKALKEKEQKEKELAEKKNKARAAAFKALKAYVALVNPTLDDAFIESALDVCEGFKLFSSKDAQTSGWISIL